MKWKSYWKTLDFIVNICEVQVWVFSDCLETDMWARVQYDRWSDEAAAAARGEKEQQGKEEVVVTTAPAEEKRTAKQQVQDKVQDKDIGENE